MRPHRYLHGYIADGKFKIAWKHRHMTRNERMRFIRRGRKVRS